MNRITQLGLIVGASALLVSINGVQPNSAKEPVSTPPRVGARPSLPAYLSNGDVDDVKADLERLEFKGHYQLWTRVEWTYNERTSEHTVCGLVNGIPFVYRRSAQKSVFLSADSMFWNGVESESNWWSCMAGKTY